MKNDELTDKLTELGLYSFRYSPRDTRFFILKRFTHEIAFVGEDAEVRAWLDKRGA